ncbi:TPA: ribose 5-phosphate isomerase B [Candidatus Geothermarchaeota archaeon]|nr:ribose 5-phosphate isomerase B [Candidatus Geothermarchaeota archaeon]HIQ13240.1 ribose 5-phosphate isomerase B [Thermoprotei archaeon]
MKLGIASDHAGYKMKEYLKKRLREMGFELTDFGTYGEESVDYPDYATKLAEAISKKVIDKGILICGTGIGVSIVANKYPGVRAGIAYSDDVAELIAKHNDANVICFGGRTMTMEEALKRVEIWLNTKFEGGRHERRINKINDLEGRICGNYR